MHKLRWLLGLIVAIAPSVAVAQSGGTVQGTVVDANSMRPIPSAQVFIDGTELGTLTNAQGRYQITNVPAGQYTVRTQLLGYEAGESNVTVAAGQSVTANFRLQSTAVELEELVVTGVAGATPKAKLPFEVGKVGSEDLPVPAVTAGSAIAGKVAGARVVSGSGMPGSEPSILLRGATSINASGRSQEPLYIVDGVILAGGLAGIDAQDIESVEVVKGAAAASLYGSRAANGVIQVTTKRGKAADEGIRYTFRSEYGRNNIEGGLALAQNHPYLMTQDGSQFLGRNAAGDTVATDYFNMDNSLLLEGGDVMKTFQDNRYPGTNYDQLDRFFDPGGFRQNYFSAAGANGNTNFYLSYSNLDQAGVLNGHNGYQRQNFRLNLDHGLSQDVSVSASAFYSLSDRDVLRDGSGSAFYQLSFLPPNVDLLKRDEDGELIIQPDPRSQEENPVYRVRAREETEKAARFMGSASIRYSPVTWFDLEGSVSYDREDENYRLFQDKGYKSINPGDNSWLQRRNTLQDAMNASVTASLNRSFGDLTTRTKVRYLYEQSTLDNFQGWGSGLLVKRVPDLDAVSTEKGLRSAFEDVRSEGFFLITALDYQDKYILDALVRRDGSSLFGENERWQTYYRLSSAWRLSQESWFDVPGINEFKLRYSLGTAGGRPNFSAQYETYNISGGSISPVSLGNRNLKPEFATEHEAGLNIAFLDRFDLSLTYANSVVDDQILQVPLPAYQGFEYQWRNAGALQSKSYEASLEAQLYNSDDLNWSARVLFDRTEQEITRLDVPCYQWGVNRQNLEAVFYNCEGESLGTFYGHRWATSCADLPAGTPCDGFAKNDHGYLVFVGAGNSWRDGLGKDLWGTKGSVDGQSYDWGVPFYAVDEEGSNFLPLGNVMPDFNASFSNSLSWKNISLYTLLDASYGFDVYNQTRQWATRENRSGEMDMAGVSDELKKPIGYYNTLYDVSAINSHYVEDGSFLKLREVALSYTLGGNTLSALRMGKLDQVTLNLIGRNLKTWTNYTGFDPEVGFRGDAGGSAALNRFDAFGYPNFRTLTASVEVVF